MLSSELKAILGNIVHSGKADPTELRALAKAVLTIDAKLDSLHPRLAIPTLADLSRELARRQSLDAAPDAPREP